MKNFILVGFLLMIYNQFSYSQCIEGDCNNGFGKYNYPKGDKYEGGFKDGKCQGQGKYSWSDGSFYDGSFILNKTWGYGKYVWANGDVYEGNHLNNLKHGYGKFKYSSGEIREGNWVAGQFTGKGKKILKTGEIQEGDFVNGELFNSYSPNIENSPLCISGNCINGIGTYKWPGGSIYVGEFKNNKIWGNGKKTWTDGGEYYGEWINNEMNGNGILKFANGDRYEGEFVKDKMTGFGVLTKSNGDKLTGYFVEYNLIMLSEKQIANNSQTQLTSTSNPKSETSNNNLVSTTINKVSSTNSKAKDADGKVYKTVLIGSQSWTSENLNTSTFRNGDPIPQAKTKEEWQLAGENKQPAWCFYENNPSYGQKYGRLYNWYAVNDPRGLAPNGWHIPSDEEWTFLESYLGQNTANKLKEEEKFEIKVSYVDVGGYDETKWVSCSECSYWTDLQKKNNPCTVCRNNRGKYLKTGRYIPKTKERREEKVKTDNGWNGNNESDFSALPSGYRPTWGSFYSIKESTYFWSSTKSSNESSYYRSLTSSNDKLGNYVEENSMGFSVRCIKDNSSTNSEGLQVKTTPMKNSSKSITIGSKSWMINNLDVVNFRNGDPIPQAKTDYEWELAKQNKQPAWCYLENDPLNGQKYGVLYNGYALIDSRGIAPIGWHIPTLEEFTNMISFLGGESIAGGKLKSTTGWASNDNLRINGNGSNSSGFSALPGGDREFGRFHSDLNCASWWTSSFGNVPTFDSKGYQTGYKLIYFSIGNWGNEITKIDDSLGFGRSVRCVKD